MVTKAHILTRGTAQGPALRLEAPISFWGGVNPESAAITQGGHPQFGQIITGTILIIPKLIGSSSSSAILLELIHSGRAPAGLILGESDAILPIGAVIAGQMGWPCPPIVTLDNPPFQTGQKLSITADGRVSVMA